MRILRQKAYNTTSWKKVRAAYITAHPLCEECLKKGIVFGGTPDNPIQVHHIVSPFKNGKINYNLLLDDHNLETICSHCHGLLHSRKEKTAEELIKILDDLLLNDNWNDDTTDNN